MAPSSILWSPRTALLGVLGGLSCVFFTAGCTAVVRSEPPVVYSESEPDVIYVERAPERIETYPREYYGGVEVYLIDGRWYRRAGARWQVYRTEPVELGRRRAIIQHRGQGRGPERDERHEDHGKHR